MKHWLRALQFFRPEGPRLAGVLLLLLAAIGANLLKPWPLAIVVDSVLGDQPVPSWLGSWEGTEGKAWLLLLLAGSILLLHAGQGGLSALSNHLSIAAGLRGLRRVRHEVFACLLRLSARFHQGSRTGDLIYRASWDTYAFQTFFQQGLVTFVTALLSLGLMGAVMWQLNVLLTLAAAVIVPLLLLVIKVFGRQIRERGVAAQQADSQATSFVQQSIVTLPLIRSYTREEQERQRYSGHTALARQQRQSQHGWELVYWLGISVVFGLGTAAIVWLGAVQVLTDRLTVGQLLVFLAYLAQLYDPLNQLSHIGTTVATAGAGMQRVFELLDTPEEVRDTPQARPVRRAGGSSGAPPSPAPTEDHSGPPLLTTGALALDRVSFAYEPGQPVLREISFRLEPGQSAALIGPSGVGKTTVLNLILRFFDPTAGAVRLDGVDLRELRLQDLRQQIALVFQEPILLPGTIAENIAYGRPDATGAEIEAAARAAQADAFIQRLPRKYETVVGEGAARLSVGENQRLNLARAFLKDAPILLLDEPTSALDAESEAQVMLALRELMRGRTTLMVAHNLETVRRVDKLLVLEDGRLTQQGSPAELLEQPGYYARLVRGREALTPAGEARPD